MKTRSIVIALVLAIGVSTMGWADLNESDYRTVAENFLLYQNSSKNIVSTDTIKDGERIIAYVMVLEGGGYLLVPATTLLPPVKAYSLQSNFENLPPGYKAFLISELKTLQNEERISTRSSEPTENSERWDFLLSYKQGKNIPRDSVSKTLNMTSKWTQTYPYNKKMPLLPTTSCVLNGVSAITGCVQTAWAQIMRYNKYPARGKGVATYKWNFTLTGSTGDQSCSSSFDVILNKNYNWDNMPDVVDTNTPEYQQDEVAMLMRDLAIVNKANFNSGETSTGYDKTRLVQYFGYSSAMTERTYINDADFFQTLKAEIDSNRPVFLGLTQTNTTGGHAVVGDGYISDTTGNKIHLNMGWGGNYDNVYSLNGTIDAGQTGTFSTSPSTMTMLYNIKPCSSANNDCYENLIAPEATDSISGSAGSGSYTISGQFKSIYDTDAYYPVYLKGLTQLSGIRQNMFNQGFFITVYDSKRENVVAGPTDSYVSYQLPAGKYYIDVSLQSDLSYYPYSSSTAAYTVNIVTQSLTSAEISAIDNKNTAPVINNVLNAISVKNTAPYRIRIDSADADNGDTVTLSASSSNANVTVSMSNDVLTITPNVNNSYSEVTVTASDGKAQTTQPFHVFVTDTLFGKNFTIADTFASQDDIKTTPDIILEGECIIKGYNGSYIAPDTGKLTNYTFFISVSGKTATSDPGLQSTFPINLYQIGTSLKQASVYYPYVKGKNDQYTLTVSCPYVKYSAATISNLLGISMDAVGLGDVIEILRILSRIDPAYQGKDINGDGKFGLEEVIYILQKIAGLR